MTDLRTAILESLQDVAPEADLASLDENDDIRDELDLDSMDILNLALGIHKRTGIDVPERHYSRLSTVKKAMEYLETRLPV